MTRTSLWMALLGAAVTPALLVPATAAPPPPPHRASTVAPVGSQEVPPASARQVAPFAAAMSNDTVRPGRYRQLPAISARRSTAVPSRVHVLVMRAFWSSSPPKFPDTGQMKSLMKDTATWFKHTSRGRQHVTSHVTPWLRIGGGFANCGDTRGSTNRAVAAARAHGTGPSGFNRFMLVMPQCATNSLGEEPGRVTWIKEAQPHVDVLVHELGHNLGLDHANSLICSADKRRVTQGGKCTSQEYGDLWDAMGLSSRPYSVGVLKRLGWAGRTATATKSGTWQLRDAEASGSGLQGLQVKVSRKVSYWLQYVTTDVASAKEPGSFPISGTPGLQIRIDTGAKSMHIVDAAPGNPIRFLTFPDPDFVDVALPVGSSFTTPQRVRITLLSQGAAGAQVRIDFHRAAGPPDAPTLAAAVADQSQSSDHEVQLLVHPGASDNGQVVLGYLATRYPGGQSIFIKRPGGGAAPLDVSYVGSAAEQWTVRAVNQVGTSPESPKVTQHLAAPVLTVTAPTAGSTVSGPGLHVTVDAQPDPFTQSPINRVSVCLDDGTCATDSSAPWAADLQAGPGAHSITVTATDSHGNDAVVTVPVTVVIAPPTVHIDSPVDGATFPTDFTVDGAVIDVTATVTPNPASGPIESVSFVAYPAGSTNAADTSTAYAAPWSGQLFLNAAGDYRIEVVATDQYSSSAPATITVHVPQSPP